MNPLDPLEGTCPAQHPDITSEQGRCDRGAGHDTSIHHSPMGGFFTIPNECRRCMRQMKDVLSMSFKVIGRQCPVCGRLAEP